MNSKTDRLLALGREIKTLKTVQNEIKAHPEQSPIDVIQWFVSSLERVADHVRSEDE